jgi:hypothetical protein
MSLPYNPHSTPDHDALLIRHAGCGLVLADMDSGEVLRLNQSWSQWLEQDALQVGTCLWDERWWEQAQAVRAAVGLGRYGVAMPPTPMLARHAQGHMVLLQFSCEPVTQDGRRLSVCTLQALPSSEPPSAPSSQDSALLSLVQTLSPWRCTTPARSVTNSVWPTWHRPWPSTWRCPPPRSGTSTWPP